MQEASAAQNLPAAARTAAAAQLAHTLTPAATHAAGARFAAAALDAWSGLGAIQVVGCERAALDDSACLPVLSFNVAVVAPEGVQGGLTPGRHAFLHPTFVAAVLRDVYGIQV